MPVGPHVTQPTTKGLLITCPQKTLAIFFSPRAGNCQSPFMPWTQTFRALSPSCERRKRTKNTISLVGTPFFNVFGKPACRTSQKRSTSVGFPCGRPTFQKRFYLFAIWKIISKFFRRYRESNSHDPHRLWHNYQRMHKVKLLSNTRA